MENFKGLRTIQMEESLCIMGGRSKEIADAVEKFGMAVGVFSKMAWRLLQKAQRCIFEMSMDGQIYFY